MDGAYLSGQRAFYSVLNFGGIAYRSDIPPEELVVLAHNYRADLLRDCPKVTSSVEINPDWVKGFIAACTKYRKITR